MIAPCRAQLTRSLTRKQLSISSIRSFSDTSKDIEENKLMEKLLQQHLEREERTILPYNESEKILPTVDFVPIPYPEECSVVSGVDAWAAGRKVIIHKPTRNTMQSGTYNTRHWEMRFESPKTWENPLMGWTSTDDPIQSVLIKFDTKEEAMSFARKQRWKYEVAEPTPTGDFVGKLAYAHNFLPLNIENKIKKEGKKSSVQFTHAKGRQSHYVKPLKYHGDGAVAQHGGEAKD